MMDPKRVEFAPYDGLPHLYVPVVTEPKQAASALQWAVPMERRLKIFERIGVRKIATFNEKQAAGEFDRTTTLQPGCPSGHRYRRALRPHDGCGQGRRGLHRPNRAAWSRPGIRIDRGSQHPFAQRGNRSYQGEYHQPHRPAVAPGYRLARHFGPNGYEKLLGQGDMLFSRVDWGKPKRIQGCYVSDEGGSSTLWALSKEQSTGERTTTRRSCPARHARPFGGAGAGSAGMGSSEPSEDDPLLWDAARIVVDSQLGSTSGLQRRLKVGYARAGSIMDMLEEKGVVGPPDGSKPREVLLDAEGSSRAGSRRGAARCRR